MAFGVGQLQRHIVFAGNGFYHPDGYEAQAARQIFGQAHNLRTLHAGGRLDFIARNHRPRLGQHHPHFHAKVLELFLNHAAGHFQRFVGHGFLAQQGFVQQGHLRQLAVGHIGKQGLLPLFGHARALGHLRHALRLYRRARFGKYRGRHQRRDVRTLVACCSASAGLVHSRSIRMQRDFALTQSLLAHFQVLRQSAPLLEGFQERIQPGTYGLGTVKPGKPEGPRTAQQTCTDGQ